jgi:hypothetical protein
MAEGREIIDETWLGRSGETRTEDNLSKAGMEG